MQVDCKIQIYPLLSEACLSNKQKKKKENQIKRNNVKIYSNKKIKSQESRLQPDNNESRTHLTRR